MRVQRRHRTRIGLLATATVTMLVGAGAPALASAAAAPLAVSGQVYTATGRMDAAKKLDPASLSDVAPADQAGVYLARLVESATDKGANKLGAGTLTVLTSTKTDNAGRYELTLQPDSGTLAAAAGNDGWVNFLLIVATDGIKQVSGTTRHWNGRGWDSAGRTEYDPARAVNTYVTRDAAGKPLQGSDIGDTPLPQAGHPYPACDYDVLGTANKPTKILELHNSFWSHSIWEYGQRADSDIGIGIKPTTGNWSLSGEWHVGNSTGAAISGWQTKTWDGFIVTTFEYETIRLHPFPPLCNDMDVVYAKRWLGGVSSTSGGSSGVGCGVAPQNRYVTRYERGSTFHRTQNRGYKFSAGVALPGITLTAVSGYSTNMDVKWEAFLDWMDLCGNDNYPPYSGIIYVW